MIDSPIWEGMILGSIRFKFHGVHGMQRKTLLCVVLVLLVAPAAWAETDQAVPKIPAGARTDLNRVLFTTTVKLAEFSPQSDKVVLVSHGGRFGVWDTRTGSAVQLEGLKDQYVRAAAVTADGKSVTAMAPTKRLHTSERENGPHAMVRWDLSSGKKMKGEKGTVPGMIKSQAYIPLLDAWVHLHVHDGYSLYDAKTAEEIYRFTADRLGVKYGIEVSGYGRLLALLDEANVIVFDLSKPATVCVVSHTNVRDYLTELETSGTPLQFAFGSQALLVAHRDHIKVWNLHAQREAYQIPLPESRKRIVSFSTDGSLMA